MKLRNVKCYRSVKEIIADPENDDLLGPALKEGFTVSIPGGREVFCTTSKTRRSMGLAKAIVAACPEAFPGKGCVCFYCGNRPVQEDGTMLWEDYVYTHMEPATLTRKWFDSLNRMLIDIQGRGFSHGAFEDEGRIFEVEVP